MARSQVDRLAKVGLEGFALIEEYYGKNSGRSNNKVPSPQGHQAADHYNHRKNSGRSNNKVPSPQLGHQAADHYHHHHRQQPYVYHGPQVYTVKQAVSSTSSEAVAQYYGQPCVYQRPQVSTVREPLVSSNTETAQYYYGRPSFCQQGHQDSAAEEAVITSKDTARYFGGIVINDFHKKEAVPRA